MTVSNTEKQTRYRRRYRDYQRRSEELDTSAMTALAAAVLCLDQIDNPIIRQRAFEIVLNAVAKLFDEAVFRQELERLEHEITAKVEKD